MQKIKITYIVSKIDKALEFEWVAMYLDKNKYELSFVILGTIQGTALKNKLDELGIANQEIYLAGKRDYPKAWWQTRQCIKRWNPDIVHCHLLDATLIGLSVSKWAGIQHRIYTRHHSTFHHVYAPRATRYDRWANKTASKIVAVSPLVKKVLVEKEHVDPGKVMVINHGLDLQFFAQVGKERIQAIKHKLGLQERYPVIGSVARYDHWKGVSYTIEAFKNLIHTYPNAKLVLANAGKGDSAAEVSTLARTLPEGSYIEVDFEPDVPALYACFDVLVHVPVDDHSEAFGQVYIEAMASQVPVVGTRSGIGNEILLNLETGYVTNYQDADSIVQGICYWMEHTSEKNQVTRNAFELVRNTYTFEHKLALLTQLYHSLCP